jgi:hypothetical protein
MSLTSVTSPPAGVPILDVGNHRGPDAGACVMEFVSVLAGEPWSDRPWCTQPLLAAVARCVNDSVSPAARGELSLLAPELAGAVRRGPVTNAAVIDAVVTAAARYVAVPQATLQLRDRAYYRSMTHTVGPLRRWWHGITRCDFTQAAERALCALVLAVARCAGDAALLDVLQSGVAGYRATGPRTAIGSPTVAAS